MSRPTNNNSRECNFAHRNHCGVDRCRAFTAKTWIFLTPSQDSYWRCEGAGFDNCETYKAFVSDSGAYKIFELPGRAAFAKVDEKLKVTEVLTLMDGVYISRGQCMAAPPPLIRTR